MKTNLLRTIASADDARAYLKELFDNGESYHPDEDAADIAWSIPVSQQPTAHECVLMDALIDQVCSYIDACEYMLTLGNTLGIF